MSSELPITRILKRFKLLDAEEYLLPPEHPNVMRLIKQLVNLRAIVEDGKILTPEQQQEVNDMQTAIDYYDDALDDEVVRLTGPDGDGEEDFDDDEEEGDDEEEQSGPSGTSGSGDEDNGEVVGMEIDSEEDESYEP